MRCLNYQEGSSWPLLKHHLALPKRYLCPYIQNICLDPLLIIIGQRRNREQPHLTKHKAYVRARLGNGQCMSQTDTHKLGVLRFGAWGMYFCISHQWGGGVGEGKYGNCSGEKRITEPTTVLTNRSDYKSWNTVFTQLRKVEAGTCRCIFKYM